MRPSLPAKRHLILKRKNRLLSSQTVYSAAQRGKEDSRLARKGEALCLIIHR